MRRKNTEQIGSVIGQFMRQEGLETPYNQFRIIKAWPEVMGEGINKYTGKLFVQNQTLNIQILTPTLRQNLMMEHRALARRLNEYIQAQVIEDIKFF